jgi:hypothetical protein
MLDPLTRSDIDLSRNMSPAEKLAQALELMQVGIRLKRAALQEKFLHASSDEIEARLEQWLLSDD